MFLFVISGHVRCTSHVCFVPKADIRATYSITSSARCRNDSGMVRPSVLAVLRLTMS